MNQEERKAFFRWLDSANNVELEKTLVRLQALEFRLTEEPALIDLRWMIEKINQEIRIRQTLGD